MKINNFYPLTPEVSKKLLEAKLTAAEWRIWIYLVGIDPWGDIYKDIDTLTVMAECDVSKATFYRAIAKFQELELFDIQDKGISIRNLKGVSSLKNETPVSEMRQDSQNCETRRKNETKKSKMRQDSQNCENQPPEPAPSKASEVPHTIQTKRDLTDTTEAENCCVLKKFEDRLKIHGIHLYVFNENSKTKNLAGYGISPNPKMCAIRKIIEGMPPERAERAIAAFLAWLPNSKNIRCKYAAFATSLRQNWESS
jgi:hypothetical protein